MKGIWPTIKDYLSKFFFLASAVIIALALILPLVYFASCPGPAQAGSGYSMSFNGLNGTYEDGHIQKNGTKGSWSSKRDASVGTGFVDATCQVKMWRHSDSRTMWYMTRVPLTFLTAGLPDDLFVSRVTLELTTSGSKSITGGFYVEPRVVVTPYTGGNIPTVNDYSNFTDTLLCTSIAYTNWPAGVGEKVTFEFTQAGRDIINPTGVTKLMVRDFVWDTLNNDMTLNTADNEEKYELNFYSVEAGTPSNRPLLTVYYGDMPINRSATQNPDNAGTGGAGDNVTSIKWKTVRCAYSDEELGFKVTGDAGTQLQLRLVNESGKTIAQIDDSIRTDGFFYWRANCGLGDRGFVRCTDLLHSVNSEWGYIAEKPDGSCIHNYTYAQKTYYPQYTEPFSTYIVDEDGLMLVHWKTDVQSTEQADYSLRLYRLGNSSETVYNKTFAWLLDNYWKNVYANNDFQAGIRYAIFVMDLPGGASNYNGLIIDLDKPYIGANQGFYQALIYKNDTAEYSITHSAHCYIKDKPGIVYSLDKEDYNAGEAMKLFVELDSETGALAMWDKWEVKNCISDTVIMQTLNGNLNNGEFVISGLEAGNTKYTYFLRITLYKQGSAGCTFDYIHDVPYTVGGGVKKEITEDVVGWAEGFLSQWGLGGTTGKWLACIVLMTIAFIIGHSSRVLRVVFPLMVLGLFIVAGWLDIWVIALLALGAGVGLFLLMRKGFSKEGD